jgi:outer membrane protein insertion porin family
LRPGRARSAQLAALALALVALPTPVEGADELLSELQSVAEVRLEGVRSVPRRELRAVMKTQGASFWPWMARSTLRMDFVRADTAAIASIYRHHGFLDATVGFTVASHRKRDQVAVAFHVAEGLRARVASVTLVGALTYPEEQLRRKLWARKGRPFSPAYLQLDTLAISAAYQEQGRRPHTVGHFTREGTRVHVVYEILEGPRYRFGEAYVAGLERTSERMVRRELVLPRGSYFRLSRLRQSLERLYESGLFDRVQISPIPDSTNSEILFYVLVHERKRRWLDGGLGSGTSERFRVTGEWGHRNLYRTGLQGALGARLALDADGRFLLARGEGTLLSPWILGTRIPARATLYYQNKDDRADPQWVLGQEARGLAFQLRRNLNRFTTLLLTQDNTYMEQDLDYNPGVVLTAVQEDSLSQFFVEKYQTHRLQLALDRDFRNHPVTPSQGSRQLASAEVAGGPLAGGSSFEKYVGGSTWYTPVGANAVLAARLRGGVVRPFGNRFFSPPEFVDEQTRRVPLEDRFRLGGVNSVRGYNEDAIAPSGGLALLLGNVELRVPVWGPLGAELFLDAGNVWARPEYVKWEHFVPAVSTDRLDPSEVRYTTGAGLRFNLPVGPLRLDWAWGLRSPEAEPARPGQPQPESPEAIVARWQFAIGPSF